MGNALIISMAWKGSSVKTGAAKLPSLLRPANPEKKIATIRPEQQIGFSSASVPKASVYI
jgi:hypothetical protein